MTAEALVVWEADQPPGRLPSTVRVTQSLPPRLALVTSPEAELGELASQPGVLGVFEADVPEPVLAELSEVERLFVSAWLERRRPKTRPGAGLPWDAEGFQPPDGPSR